MLYTLLNFIIINKSPNLQNVFIFSKTSASTSFLDFLFEQKLGE